tara:strand:- start:8743 stop:10782 length:2040 start_codon:yes stop_codon:yes gene_type:complete
MAISTKRTPNVGDLNRAVKKIYDDINDIINSVNREVSLSNPIGGKPGDIRVIKDSSSKINTTKHKLEFRSDEGWDKVITMPRNPDKNAMIAYNTESETFEWVNIDDALDINMSSPGKATLSSTSNALSKYRQAYSVMGSGNNYANGLLLAGSETHESKFLRKDGQWASIPSASFPTGDSGNAAIYDNSGVPTLKDGITQAEMQIAIGGVYTDTNTNQLTTFNIGVDTNTNATTIAHGETLTLTGGTGISTETTADGTVTFTNTVTNTDVNVSVGNLETRLGEIDTSITIGNSSSINTTISGDLTVSGNDINFPSTAHSTISVNPATNLDTEGYRLFIGAGQGTGTAKGGSIYLRTSLAGGSSNSTANAYTNILGVHGTGDIGARATSKLFFDNVLGSAGGGHTYIQESANDVLDIYVGGDQMLTLDESNSRVNTAFDVNLTTQNAIVFNTYDNNDKIYGDGTDLVFMKDDSDVIFLKDNELRSDLPIKVKEQASAISDTSSYGQIWVKNDTPNNLYFTNDAGNDVQITNGSNLAGGGSSSNYYWVLNAGFNYGYAGGTKVYMPLNGYIIESSGSAARNEYQVVVMPHDGYLSKIIVRSEEACGSSVVGLHKSSNGTEIPNVTASNSVTVDMAVDDTAYTFTFGESATVSGGDAVAISFDPTNDANDTVMTIVFVLDGST